MLRASWMSLVVLTVICGGMRSHVVTGGVVSKRMQRLPRVTVWAWERREDLSAVDSANTAVAALDRTIYVEGSIEGSVEGSVEGDDVVRSVSQKNALLLPASAGLVRIAVVRVEMRPGIAMTESSANTVAASAAEAARVHGVAALQVDFDATKSQRDWYRMMLERLRTKMPAEMPLSITALASWCSYDRWMSELPVDEAVPMMFRMEPDRAPVAGSEREMEIREPLCMGSIGVSTREPWPQWISGRRVYLFPDGGWRRDDVVQTIGDVR